MSERDDRAWLLREKYGGVAGADFEQDYARLAAGEPLAYVIGHVPFADTTIRLDSHPLIPRPETEYWTMRVIDELKKGRGAPRILDLCAGSGCIGIAILAAIPESRVDFVEIDESHHATIAHNILLNGIDPARTNIRGGDLFERADATYDVIVSNPPYIDRDAETAEESVLSHEPHRALFADEHGFALIRKILEGALTRLTEGGVLWVEHEPVHEPLIAACARELGYGHIETCKDQYGVMRFSRIAR